MLGKREEDDMRHRSSAFGACHRHWGRLRLHVMALRPVGHCDIQVLQVHFVNYLFAFILSGFSRKFPQIQRFGIFRAVAQQIMSPFEQIFLLFFLSFRVQSHIRKCRRTWEPVSWFALRLRGQPHRCLCFWCPSPPEANV